MSNYIKKAAAHARLLKLASAARLIRRQRALQKYAQAVQMQKAALSTGAQAGIGAGLGGLIGGGIGYGLGKKDKKLLSTLIGAGIGAGAGGLGGYGLGSYLNRNADLDAYLEESRENHFTPEQVKANKEQRAKKDAIRAYDRKVRKYLRDNGMLDGNSDPNRPNDMTPAMYHTYQSSSGDYVVPEGFEVPQLVGGGNEYLPSGVGFSN